MFMLRLCALALVCITACLSAGVEAQSYPSRPIRYIIGSSAGGSADIVARLLGRGLTQNLGQPVTIDLRPGAGANLGAELGAKAAPDGYTLYQPTISQTLNATLYQNLAYDIIRDFYHITLIVTEPNVVVVHPSLPAKSIADFIKLAKAKPGAMDFASAGAGTFTFLGAVLFSARAGIKLTHVSYKGGGPALNAVIAGEVPVYFAPIGASLQHFRQGRLRALGVTTAVRVAVAPEVPTVAESGLPGFQFGNFYGLAAPAKTPREITSVIYNATIKSLNDPALRQQLNDLGFVIVGNTPEEFAAHIKSNVESMAKIVHDLNLKPD